MDSSNYASRDEVNISDQIYMANMFGRYYNAFYFYHTKMQNNIGLALNPNFMSSFLRELYFFKYAFSAITLKILNSYNKSLKMFTSHIFGPKRCCMRGLLLSIPLKIIS